MAVRPLDFDDRNLLGAVAGGDTSALEDLYDRYAGRAFGLAYRMLNDRAEAEEVVQDSFLALWRHAGRYDMDRGAVGTWLLHIVRNRCVDRLRAARTRPHSVGPEELAWRPDTADTPTAALQNLAGEDVRRALALLPIEQRQAIELAYFGSYTHQEIAEGLNLPLGTVKGRLRLGLQRLRGILAAS